MVSHMKTTLDLPDDLLLEAKATAARRRTSLKAIVEHALRREIGGDDATTGADRGHFSLDEHGFPVMKKSGVTPVTGKTVRSLSEDE